MMGIVFDGLGKGQTRRGLKSPNFKFLLFAGLAHPPELLLSKVTRISNVVLIITR